MLTVANRDETLAHDRAGRDVLPTNVTAEEAALNPDRNVRTRSNPFCFFSCTVLLGITGTPFGLISP